MTRKRFTERQVITTLICQGVVIHCFRCCKVFRDGSNVEREHVLEVALGGKDDPSNCVYSCSECHAKVTNGTKATSAGSSKQRIAKVRRILNPKPSKRHMQKTGRKIPAKVDAWGKAKPWPSRSRSA